MLLTRELEYELDESLIATHPVRPREAARLLVVRRSMLAPFAGAGVDNSHVAHMHVRDLPTLLEPGDLLALNVTSVVPARFTGVRRDTGGKAEGLYLASCVHQSDGSLCWRVLVRARRQKAGVVIDLDERGGGRAAGGEGRECRRQ